MIAGVDAVALRDSLRHQKSIEFYGPAIAERLGIEDAEAEPLIAGLLELGLIEHRSDTHYGPTYRLTLAGNALANASAAKPVTRTAARRHLNELIERAEAANASSDYLYWVERLVCFGSFLDETVDRLSDVDVAVELIPRYVGDELMERERARVEAAALNGRRFSTIVDELGWPETEMWLLLKARSPVLSLTSTDDGILKDVPTRVVYTLSE
jgi:predicted nucleotidyltransferase